MKNIFKQKPKAMTPAEFIDKNTKDPESVKIRSGLKRDSDGYIIANSIDELERLQKSGERVKFVTEPISNKIKQIEDVTKTQVGLAFELSSSNNNSVDSIMKMCEKREHEYLKEKAMGHNKLTLLQKLAEIQKEVDYIKKTATFHLAKLILIMYH